MAQYDNLKQAIQDVIRTNGNNEITGALLQQSLLAMINSLGVGYQFMGVATPTTNPGTPDQKVFYIASIDGVYSNFGGLSVANGEIAILKYDDVWTKEITGAATSESILPIMGGQIDMGNALSYYISTALVWRISGTHRIIYVKNFRGKKLTVTPNNTRSTVIMFLKSYSNPASDQRPDFCDGYGTALIRYETETTVTIPNDCSYIYFQSVVSNVDATPASVVLQGLLPDALTRLNTIEPIVAGNSENISALQAGKVDKRAFTINVSSIWEVKTGFTISSTDGHLASNGGYNCYVIPIPNGTTRITGIGSAYRGSPLVALYTGTPSAETHTRSISATKLRQDEAFDITPNAGEKYIVINTSRAASVASGTIYGYSDIFADIDDVKNKVETLQENFASLENDDIYNGIAVVHNTDVILGIGASLMRGNADGTGTNNSWLHTMATKVGCQVYNDALGGTNICYHANRLYDGTILGTGTAPIESVAAILIMHTHNKDVFTLPQTYQSYSAEDYETNNIVPFENTTGDTQDDVVYAQAFDYVIKKIKALYNAKKSSEEYVSSVQTYMGTYIPKPCQIVLATHWHDARTKYNESVRKLAIKWGIPLVRFDDKIGFTKNQLNPSTNCQPSLEYVGNIGGASPIETIDGVAYGWHPMCGSDDVFIQRKMAIIAAKSFDTI